MVKQIRVLIVDDSILFRKLLIDRLALVKNIEVIDYAVDAFDAERKILSLKPDVVTMDIEMPRMSGMDFLKQLLPKYNVPVVMVSSLNVSVFEALSTGAVDFVRKPDMQSGNSVDAFIRDLSTKIYIASMSKIKGVVSATKPATPQGAGQQAQPVKSAPITINSSVWNDNRIIAIGASTGGTEATLAILRELPANSPGIIVVQHMPVGFTEMYAQRLNRICAMEVKEAKTGDKISKGKVFVAPGDMQLQVVKLGNDYVVKCFMGEKVSGHRPSVDVMFNSVAEAAGSNAVGIILTGMGQDGANGLLNMRKHGAYTIGQDKDSCVVYGMPMVANNIGAVMVQAACEDIPQVLARYLNSR